MFSSPRLSLALGLSLLTLPVVLVNQANAQSIVLSSFKSPGCASAVAQNSTNCPFVIEGTTSNKRTADSLKQHQSINTTSSLAPSTGINVGSVAQVLNSNFEVQRPEGTVAQVLNSDFEAQRREHTVAQVLGSSLTAQGHEGATTSFDPSRSIAQSDFAHLVSNSNNNLNLTASSTSDSPIANLISSSSPVAADSDTLPPVQPPLNHVRKAVPEPSSPFIWLGLAGVGSVITLRRIRVKH